MPTYNSRVIREAGASTFRVASGGSLNFDSGGALGGTIGGQPTFAERLTLTTGLTTSIGGATCIASSGLKLGQDIAASGVIGTFEIFDFGNGIKFFISRSENAPSAAGSPGSLMIRLPGTGTPSSAVELMIKRGDNSPPSGNWVSFQTTASAG